MAAKLQKNIVKDSSNPENGLLKASQQFKLVAIKTSDTTILIL